MYTMSQVLNIISCVSKEQILLAFTFDKKDSHLEYIYCMFILSLQAFENK